MNLREKNLARLREESFDVVVVGGGMNGAVCAKALSAQGLNVALIDKGDFASTTSQESSNLAWGGIKYMETYEFKLVRELCQCRNHLIRSYPSNVKEIRFLATVPKKFRHFVTTLWAGTWLYWLMGSGFTKTPKIYSRSGLKKQAQVIQTEQAAGGFEYSDAFILENDARFVFHFIRDAIQKGCCGVNYVKCERGSWEKDHWQLELEDQISKEKFSVQSKVMINAAGPFADELNQLCNQKTKFRHVLSKGIHLIVPQINECSRVLAFFANDGRLFFAIPMGHRTCIGTTDTRVDKPTKEVTPEDRKFVLDNINHLLDLKQPITEKDIIAERCGVRPLAVQSHEEGKQDWVQLSRKHAAELKKDCHHISIFGGKLTDCLNVGEEMLECLEVMGIDIPKPEKIWYGEESSTQRDQFMEKAKSLGISDLKTQSNDYVVDRLWRRYGSLAEVALDKIAQDKKEAESLWKEGDYLKVELDLAKEYEMIVCLEDLLRRRSMASLVQSKEEFIKDPKTKEVCNYLFGENGEQKYQEYVSGE